MKTLTLQQFSRHRWQDVATLFFDEKTDKLEKFSYLNEWVLEYFGQRGAAAISINYPVDFFIDQPIHLLHTVLNDIAPGGASRRYWIEALGLKNHPEAMQTYELLKRATIAPIGNLRIKEAVPSQEKINLTFSLDEVCNRQHHFLEYANQRGAMVGGATGAGGESPKLLLRRLTDKIWIDNRQAGTQAGQYYLVKYPRGNYSPIDCDILRAEFHYYQELAEMGFSTIDTQAMRLEEGERYPSLWLPRFDIQQDEQGNISKRYAVESVYSMLQKTGGELNHYETLKKLIDVITQSGLTFQPINEFVTEWVKRDLLNIAFGNSDNHGRNTAFLRDDKCIQLAPIYDFAPMRADPEMIIRTMRWSSQGQEPQELAGEYRFQAIAESLQEWVDPEQLMSELRQLSTQLVNLKSRLIQRAVPQTILDHPALAFDYLPEKLKKWGLL